MARLTKEQRVAIREADARAQAVMREFAPDQAWTTKTGKHADYFGENGSRMTINTDRRGRITRVYAEYDDPHATSAESIGQHFVDVQSRGRRSVDSGRRFRSPKVVSETNPESPTQVVKRVVENTVSAIRRVRANRQ